MRQILDCEHERAETRIELCDLAQRITNELSQLAEGSPERSNALNSLRNIHFVPARRDYSP
jgi:hypothetical protein